MRDESRAWPWDMYERGHDIHFMYVSHMILSYKKVFFLEVNNDINRCNGSNIRVRIVFEQYAVLSYCLINEEKS